MKRILILCILLGCTIIAMAQTTWQVGPTRTYTQPSQVINLVNNGDIVEIDAGEYLGDVGAWAADNITLRGVGGRAHIRANGNYSQGKAIWVIKGDNYVLENIELSECTVPDQNGAGIRQEGTNLTLRNCYFHDNETGILTTDDANSTILIEYSEFARNSHPNGQAHNIYVNHIQNLTIQHSYFHGSVVGHNVKSRAAQTNLWYNRIMDESDGQASYIIDIPDGGVATIAGNLIQQGASATNKHVMSYGGENPNIYSNNELNFYNNTVINQRHNGYFFYMRSDVLFSIFRVFNNIFAGPMEGAIANNSSYDIDMTSNNRYFSNPNDAGLIDYQNYDYGLTSTSPVINQGIPPTTMALSDIVYEYVHPHDRVSRPVVGDIDMGAYEYGANQTFSFFIFADGPTSLCPNETTTLSGSPDNANSTSPYVFNWSTGQNGQDIIVSEPGTYYATVTDANGLTASASYTVGTSSNCDNNSGGGICGVSPNSPTVWQVGPSRTYTTPNQVLNLVEDGDIIDIDAGEYISNDEIWTAHNLTIRGVGGKAHIKPSSDNPNDAIWVIQGDNYLLEDMEFSESVGFVAMGAGLRSEGTNLTIRNCYFHDNEQGFLATANSNSTVLIDRTEFYRNYHPNDISENIYADRIKNLTISHSYIHGGRTGNNIASAAAKTNIMYSRVMDEIDGSSHHLIEFTSGGVVNMLGNVLQQSANTVHWPAIAYGNLNNGTHPVNEFNFYNNTFVEERGSAFFFDFYHTVSISNIRVFNNLFAGDSDIANGNVNIDMTNNLHYRNINDAGLEDYTTYNYELTSTSPAINTGVTPSTQGVEVLVNNYFTYPEPKEERVLAGIIDIGAFEYGAGYQMDSEIRVVGPTSLCPDETTELNAGDGFRYYNWYLDGNRMVEHDQSQRIVINKPGHYEAVVRSFGGTYSRASYSININHECSPCDEPNNTVTVTEVEGLLINNHPMQIGRPFRKGEIMDYPQVLINNVPVLTQANVKTRWEDGSVKHAILNFIIPSIKPYSTTILSFQNQTNGHHTGSLTNTEMLDTRFNFDATIELTNASNQVITSSARQILQNGHIEYWLEGEVATSVILTDHSINRATDIGFDNHRSFRPIFHATFWHDLDRVEVRYIGEIANSETLQPMFYDVELTAGNTSPISLYQELDLEHHGLSRWTKKYWIDSTTDPKLNINHNIAYLAATTLIPNYNPTLEIPENITDTYYATQYNAWTNSNTDRTLFGGGQWTKYMPTGGGRFEIGIYPEWTVRWLYTGDWRDEEVAFGSADLAAAWPYHLREGDTNRSYLPEGNPSAMGKPVSVHARPGFWFNFGTHCLNEVAPCLYLDDEDRIHPVVTPEEFNQIEHGWIPDNAHQPDPYSPQYLLSGEYWYLEEGYFLASYGITKSTPHSRGPNDRHGWGGMTNNQIRGIAWSFRNRVQMAALAPDDSPEKEYFTEMTSHAITNFESILNLPASLPEYSDYWQWGMDNHYDIYSHSGSREPNTLQYWIPPTTDNGYGCDESKDVAASTRPWQVNLVLFALGRGEELGFNTTQLRQFTGQHLVDMLTHPDYSPYFVQLSEEPVIQASTGQYFQTWADLYNEICQDHVGDTPIFEREYLSYSMGASSFMTDLPNGDMAWDFIVENAANNPSLNNNPEWALLPRNPVNSTLAIAQTTFEARLLENVTYLQWRITNNKSIASFELEKATTNHVFNKIASLDHTTYQWQDKDLQAGTTYYYRLKIIFEDGSEDYSNIEIISLDEKNSLAVYPNPATNVLHLKWSEESTGHIRLFNSQGILMKHRQLDGNQNQNVDLSNLAAGIYYLEWESYTGRKVYKVVVL